MLCILNTLSKINLRSCSFWSTVEKSPRHKLKERRKVLNLENFLSPEYPDFSQEGEPPCSVAPDLFFPTERETTGLNGKVVSYYTNEYEAKYLCGTCPYKAECLEYALKNPQPGIWGGTNEGERKRLLSVRPSNVPESWS